MTDDIGLTVKKILDKIGLETVADELNVPDPWLEEYFRTYEAERLEAEGYYETRELSVKGGGQCYAISGNVRLEYSGKIAKKYEGDAILFIKPDDSVLVHGIRGLNPICYMARAADIRFMGKEKTLSIEAAAGNDRLSVIFLKVNAFSCLLKGKPPVEMAQEKVQEKAKEKIPEQAKEKTQEYAKEKVLEKAQEKIPETVQPPAETVVLSEEEKALEARLKRLRIELALGSGITFLPAIFDNKILHQLIRQRPRTVEDLRLIKGFGAKRVERYGERVLQALNGPAYATAEASSGP